MTQPTTDTIRLKTYHGVQVDPDDVAAIYHADDFGWMDMPECRPRSRCRVRPGVEGGDRRVVCLMNGDLLSDPAVVEVDAYADPKYSDVRAEGVARWKRVDRARGAGRG